ncbi:MAG: 4Fe-4S dicluster domain-containing protein [Deferrisomatales bacterium]
MTEPRVPAPVLVCDILPKMCIGCRRCVSLCTYGAITMVDTLDGDKAFVDPSRCHGDGLCNSLCATGAAVLRGQTNADIFRQIDSAFRSV